MLSFVLLTFISFFFKVCLHFSKLVCIASRCLLPNLPKTISSANIIFQGVVLRYCLSNLSIVIANRKGLNSDPWCNPTLSLYSLVDPTEVFTAVMLSSYLLFLLHTLYILKFLKPSHNSSLGIVVYYLFQIHNCFIKIFLYFRIAVLLNMKIALELIQLLTKSFVILQPIN